MQHAILLIYDEPEKKTVEVPTADPLIKFLDKLLGKSSTETVETDCFCLKNNSVDRAKILIRYLRKNLGLQKSQITFLRASKFKDGKDIKTALEYLFEKYQNDDVLFYYAGHGIAGPKLGWSLGEYKNIFYRSLHGIFKNFYGRLVFINDCCYALAIDQHLKFISGSYLLFGACRRGCTSSESILDPILGYWFHKRNADPRVMRAGRLKEFIMDEPAYATRGSFYNCICGSKFEPLKLFKPSNAPSLRRGSDLDSIWFPK